MESVYAGVALVEGVVILLLLAITVGQRVTITKYQEDYLGRISAQKWAGTDAR